VTAASFTADLTTLRSDDERRDGQLRRQALETDRFPEASFALTAPLEIGAIATGETVSGSLLGDLTLHGITRFVELAFDARLADGIVTLVATTEIVFADYGIEQPRSMIVLSVADRGTLELQLHLSRG
jgi:polyisoprenoid-binding protein YceI